MSAIVSKRRERKIGLVGKCESVNVRLMYNERQWGYKRDLSRVGMCLRMVYGEGRAATPCDGGGTM